MSFIKRITYAQEGKSKYRKVAFLALPTGTSSTIRVMEEEATLFQTHYINGYTIKCLGDDCPTCRTNKEIIMQYPEDFREQDGYIPRRNRYYVNVYDKTLAKNCEKCGIDVKDVALPVCPKCNTFMGNTQALPVNKLKVLARGPQLFNLLADIDTAVTNDAQVPLGITNFDISLVVRGTGRDTTITCIPNTSSNDAIIIDEENDSMYDLDEAIIILTPNEILDLASGITLRDIFVARSADKPSTEKVAVSTEKVVTETTGDGREVNEEFKTTITSRVNSLFKGN